MKIVNLLSKYIPAHFKIAPKDIEIFLDELLDFTTINRARYLINTLNPDSTEIEYDISDNLDPFKESGVVKIENEYIKYDTKDLVEHKLKNIERGYFNTEAVAHCNQILWSAVLAEDVDPYTTTITFTSITDMSKIPKKGKFAIFSDTGDLEVISYSDFNQWLNGYQFTNVIRGDDGTSAYNHGKGSYIQEYANLTIEQVDTVKYDKGLWSATLATALTDTDTSATISSKFTASLNSAVISNDIIIYLKDILGTVPKNGYVLIDSEIIRYGNFIIDYDMAGNPLDTGRIEECIRGTQSTSKSNHTLSTEVYFTVPTTGEFLIEDEYIRYDSYDEITRTFSGLLRGRYGSIPASHDIAEAITERRHTELEPTGVFRIGNEYLKYWYVDDDYFYVDPRPALNAKTYYHTTGSSVTSIIEGHNQGALITTYHFDDENSYLVDFIHTVAEHLDLAINTKVDQFEDFSDVDNVKSEYMQFIVKQLGENLDDYQNLPFFTGTNSDYRIRLFTKELVNLYKEKGLLSTLKLWHLIISEPLTSYQDLWTFNYCSFYSLPFLLLILYEPLREFYPNNENFFRPQISKSLQEELAEFYENKNIISSGTNYPVPNLKLLIHNWEYFCKTDDDVKSSDGRNFDDKVVPCASIDDLGYFYDQTNVELQIRNTSTTIPLPFYVEDYDIDLFKFEEELDATKNTMPDSLASCYPIKTDEGLISDYSFEWIRDTYVSDIFDYCTLTDKALPLRTDLSVLRDLTSDINNAKLELDHNTTLDETELIVKVTDGKLYDPDDHIVSGTNPKIVPKGFVKFGDEIISYTGLEFFDHHEGVFTDKKYKLTGCIRGVNSTTAADYKVNIYEENERLLADNYVEVVYDSKAVICNPIAPATDILTSVNHGLNTNDIVLFAPRGMPGSSYGGIYSTWLTDVTPHYYYVYKLTSDTFQISLTPITSSTVTPVDITLPDAATCHKIWFRLLLTRDPKGFGVSVADHLYLVQTGYNYRHLVTGVISEYDYCAETYIYGIDFVTGILPIPTVKTLGATGLPSLSTSTTYDCEIDESNFQIKYVDSLGNPIAHGLVDQDVVYFLASVGNINAYENYYVSNVHTDYFEITQSITPWGTTLTAGINNIWHSVSNHGLSNGDLVIFSGTGGGVSSGQHYLVTDVTNTSFKIRTTTSSDVVVLTIGGVNTILYSVIALASIKDTANIYMISGTRVISKEIGYQHRYSLNQHIMWRLDNEINGNDLPLVYGLTTAELTEKKLDTYTGIKDGIIWSTPHFKYGFDITTADIENFPPNEVVELILKKLKQYKPKHTVADLTIGYPLNGNQLAVTALGENYETENIMSDAYWSGTGSADSGTDEITLVHHDLHEGDIIYIEAVDDTDFTFGTIYYVKNPNSVLGTFQVSATLTGVAPFVVAGAAIDITINTAVTITHAPEDEYRIELDHDITDGVIDKTYDLPIVTFDTSTDYGLAASFFYTWKDGSTEENLIYYAPFSAYPKGLKTDVYRNRKRYINYID